MIMLPFYWFHSSIYWFLEPCPFHDPLGRTGLCQISVQPEILSKLKCLGEKKPLEFRPGRIVWVWIILFGGYQISTTDLWVFRCLLQLEIHAGFKHPLGSMVGKSPSGASGTSSKSGWTFHGDVRISSFSSPNPIGQSQGIPMVFSGSRWTMAKPRCGRCL